MLGGDDRVDAGQAGGEPAVDTGPVQMRVHQVVAARADQPDQAQQRGHVTVAAHGEVVHPDAVGEQPVGDRSRIGQGHHLAVDGEVPQQQAQLLFGAADAEPGDDVQGLHVTGLSRAVGAAGAAGA